VETGDFRIRVIEYLCWTFFALCITTIGRWVLLKVVCLAGWGTPDWAAWVQAVGSIAAIFGAYHIGDRQSKRTKLERLAAVTAICAAAINRVELVARIFTTTEDEYRKRYFEFDVTQIDGVIGAMKSIPYHELGNPEAVVAILELHDQLVFMKQTIEQADEPIDFYGTTDVKQKLQMTLAREGMRKNNILNHVLAARKRYNQLVSVLRIG